MVHVSEKLDIFVEQEAEMQRRLDRDAEIAAIMATPGDPYDELPLPIKMMYNRQEYMWLTDDQKSTLIQRECEPEF